VEGGINRCPSCGRPIEPGYRFCPSCGLPLRPEAQVEALARVLGMPPGPMIALGAVFVAAPIVLIALAALMGVWGFLLFPLLWPVYILLPAGLAMIVLGLRKRRVFRELEPLSTYISYSRGAPPKKIIAAGASLLAITIPAAAIHAASVWSWKHDWRAIFLDPLGWFIYIYLAAGAVTLWVGIKRWRFFKQLGL